MDVLAHLGRIMEARMTMHAGGVSWKTGHNTVWFGSQFIKGKGVPEKRRINKWTYKYKVDNKNLITCCTTCTCMEWRCQHICGNRRTIY